MRALDPGILMYDKMSASEQLAAGLSQQRAAASLLGLSGLLAVALASIGLYGVMSYSVTQRTREFGIRIAIGANRIDIMGLVFREGMMLVLLGMVIGLPCALGLTKLIASSLHGVKPTDPATYISISLLSLVIASVSVYLPARRAIRNPMASLRCE
jgi:ABC-type antimicrobial peptide transport system permease subunit